MIGRYRPAMIDNPRLPFRGAPPDRDAWVLAQGFRFSPEKWRNNLPDPAMWPPELDDAPEADREGQQIVDGCSSLEGTSDLQFCLISR
jgi:hypothetical protein